MCFLRAWRNVYIVRESCPSLPLFTYPRVEFAIITRVLFIMLSSIFIILYTINTMELWAQQFLFWTRIIYGLFYGYSVLTHTHRLVVCGALCSQTATSKLSELATSVRDLHNKIIFLKILINSVLMFFVFNYYSPLKNVLSVYELVKTFRKQRKPTTIRTTETRTISVENGSLQGTTGKTLKIVLLTWLVSGLSSTWKIAHRKKNKHYYTTNTFITVFRI